MEAGKLPRFTAEESLGKTKCYHIVAALNDRIGEGSVFASLMRGCTSICKCCENHGTASCCDTCWRYCPE